MRGTGRPVWDDETSADDLRALDPGSPDEPPRTPDVLVVGGGIIGLAVAAMCTRRGMRVLLVERERLAGGASGRAAGGLAPDAHPQAGPEWHAYARRSLELHRELDAEWHYGLENLDLRVVPDLVIEKQARVNPLSMAAAFARNAGVVCTRCESIDGISPGATVYATGAEATPHAVKGHLIATEPSNFELGEVVATLDSDFLCLQLPSGRIVAGGTKEPDDDTDDVLDATVDRILAKLVEVVPQAQGLAVSHRWTCFRPKIEDELPLIDRIDERTWTATGFYSTGILMAPVAGELVAGAIAGEALPEAFKTR